MILPDYRPPVSEPADVTIVNSNEVAAMVRTHTVHAVAYDTQADIDWLMSVKLVVNNEPVSARIDLLARCGYGTPNMLALRAPRDSDGSIHYYALMHSTDGSWHTVQQRFICPKHHSLRMSPLGFTIVED